MVTAFAFLAGVLLPCWGEPLHIGSSVMKINGAKCSHHSNCQSDCCLINLDNGGSYCAPKAGYTMVCLPQTKGATNIVCPCRPGLSCITKDLMCPRRCHIL
ncbi:PREDICTED: colipase-like protein 2 [Chrysochloris asiatica]|uniref:Colipase-like protein 2 n=1 Tax=Chrysochloris asiatica TaxID=185453 RepID=A0A9B0WL32_CHRAS|nr:PREDICTED: colipase-like protein 2 [Chrysochloris asiatica]